MQGAALQRDPLVAEASRYPDIFSEKTAACENRYARSPDRRRQAIPVNLKSSHRSSLFKWREKIDEVRADARGLFDIGVAMTTGTQQKIAANRTFRELPQTVDGQMQAMRTVTQKVSVPGTKQQFRAKLGA